MPCSGRRPQRPVARGSPFRRRHQRHNRRTAPPRRHRGCPQGGATWIGCVRRRSPRDGLNPGFTHASGAEGGDRATLRCVGGARIGEAPIADAAAAAKLNVRTVVVLVPARAWRGRKRHICYKLQQGTRGDTGRRTAARQRSSGGRAPNRRCRRARDVESMRRGMPRFSGARSPSPARTSEESAISAGQAAENGLFFRQAVQSMGSEGDLGHGSTVASRRAGDTGCGAAVGDSRQPGSRCSPSQTPVRTKRKRPRLRACNFLSRRACGGRGWRPRPRAASFVTDAPWYAQPIPRPRRRHRRRSSQA